LEIVEAYRNPPVQPEPEPEPVPAPEEPVEQIQEAVVSAIETEVPVVESVPTATGGSFHFMQESELDGPSFEEGAEWVDKPQEIQVSVPEAEGPDHLTVADTGIPLAANGHAQVSFNFPSFQTFAHYPRSLPFPPSVPPSTGPMKMRVCLPLTVYMPNSEPLVLQPRRHPLRMLSSRAKALGKLCLSSTAILRLLGLLK